MMEIHICNRSGSLLRAFAVGDAEEVIIGRDEGCDIQIDARSVSREHCCIEADGDEMYVRDLGSSAGTVYNGTPVDRLRLQDGMEIVVGPARLKFFESGI